MELIYGGPLFGVSRNWLEMPIVNCGWHNMPLSDRTEEEKQLFREEVRKCQDCLKIKENWKKWEEQQKRIKEYEKQRAEKLTLLRRLSCIFTFSHSDELIGAFNSDGVSTRIRDCSYCGRRKIKYNNYKLI